MAIVVEFRRRNEVSLSDPDGKAVVAQYHRVIDTTRFVNVVERHVVVEAVPEGLRQNENVDGVVNVDGRAGNQQRV